MTMDSSHQNDDLEEAVVPPPPRPEEVASGCNDDATIIVEDEQRQPPPPIVVVRLRSSSPSFFFFFASPPPAGGRKRTAVLAAASLAVVVLAAAAIAAATGVAMPSARRRHSNTDTAGGGLLLEGGTSASSAEEEGRQQQQQQQHHHRVVDRGEEYDIIDDRGHGAEYRHQDDLDADYDEGRRPAASTSTTEDTAGGGGPPVASPDKAPVGVGAGGEGAMEISEFVGPLADFIVTTDMSRIDAPTQSGECANPNEGVWLMELTTDDYPWETSYAVKDAESGDVVMAGPPAGRNYDRNTKYVGTVCVPAGEYLLEVSDKGQDGICCTYGSGSMVVEVNGRVVVTVGDSDFSSLRRYVTVEEQAGGTAAAAGDGTTPNPTKKPTAADDASESQQLYSIDIKVKTDNYGEETGYKFAKVNGGGAGPLVDMAKGTLSDDRLYTHNLLVGRGQYKLTLTDEFNGLEDGAYFSVSVDGEEVVWGEKWDTSAKGETLSYTVRAGHVPYMTGRDEEWLTAHNDRRKAYHEMQGEKYRPLVWSPILAKAASDWIDVIMPSCKITREGIEEGENMSTRQTNGARDEGPEVLLSRWVDKPLQNSVGYPDNQSMTQALWRATRYVGCGDGVTTNSDGSRCYVSICRYARAGNCAVASYPNWKAGVLADRSVCGPACPGDVCY